MKLRFKKALAKQPIGGWHFIEDGITFRGDTPEEVAQKVREYRMMGGHTIGDPMADLIEFCALRWPHLVQLDTDAIEPDELPTDALTEARGWLVTMARTPLPIDIDHQVAECRRQVCLLCPFNREWPTKPADLADDVHRRSFLLRRGKLLPGLGFCEHHHWDNRVSVLVPKDKLSPTAPSPNVCWINRTDADLLTPAPLAL